MINKRGATKKKSPTFLRRFPYPLEEYPPFLRRVPYPLEEYSPFLRRVPYPLEEFFLEEFPTHLFFSFISHKTWTAKWKIFFENQVPFLIALQSGTQIIEFSKVFNYYSLVAALPRRLIFEVFPVRSGARSKSDVYFPHILTFRRGRSLSRSTNWAAVSPRPVRVTVIRKSSCRRNGWLCWNSLTHKPLAIKSYDNVIEK